MSVSNSLRSLLAIVTAGICKPSVARSPLVTTRRSKLTDVTIEMRKTCKRQKGDTITVIRQDNKPSGTSYPTRRHTLAGAGQGVHTEPPMLAL